MNDLSDKFLDYICGGLAAEEEQKLFSAMAYDNGLREEFRSFVAINNTLKSTSGSFVPSAGATNAVYAGLGMKFPNELAAAELPVSIPFYKAKFFTGAMAGLTSVLIPVVAYILMFMPGSGDVDIDANIIKAGLNSKADIPVAESVEHIEKIATPNDTEIKTEIRYVYIDRIVNANSADNSLGNIGEDVVMADKVVQGDNNPASVASVAYSYSKTAWQQRTKLLRRGPAFDIISRPIELPFRQSSISSDENWGLALEVRGAANWNIPSETLYPKKISEFVNSGIALHYELADWVIIGADIRQETFFVQYNGEDQYGQRYEYEQHPNLTSYGFNLRFMPIEIYKFDPYFNFNLGLNNYGEVARGAFGAEYSLYTDLAFILELEYSYLFYNHQNTPFNARKAGVNYGIKYKF